MWKILPVPAGNSIRRNFYVQTLQVFLFAPILLYIIGWSVIQLRHKYEWWADVN